MIPYSAAHPQMEKTYECPPLGAGLLTFMLIALVLMQFSRSYKQRMHSDSQAKKLTEAGKLQ